MRKIKIICFISALALSSLVFAKIIPLEGSWQTSDNNSNNNNSEQQPTQQMVQAEPQQQGSLDQQVAQLSQQMDNLTQMNLPAQIDDLRQQLQKMQGDLDVEKHKIDLLQKQLRNFYADLNSRLPQQPQNQDEGQDDQNSTQAAQNDTDSTSQKQDDSSFINPEEQAYKTAFNLLQNKQYDQAIAGFKQYQTDYPNGKYMVNTHYWLGEILYLKSQPDKAMAEFQTVINDYPDSAKVPDAMLKMAMIYSGQEDYAKAKDLFKQIKDKYPNSTAAQLISEQTQQTK